MKKLSLFVLTIIALAMVGCSKNPAENFVGSYDVVATFTTDMEMPTGQTFPVETQVPGHISIHLDGDEGAVTCRGMINTTGRADKESGLLQLDDAKMDVTFELPFTDPITMTLPISFDAMEKQGAIKWTGSFPTVTYDGYAFINGKCSFEGTPFAKE